MDGRSDSFFPSILLSFIKLHSEALQLPSPLWDSRGISDLCGEKVFNWVISSDLLLLNDPDTPTLLHHFSGNCPPGISFAPSFALSCPWEVFQDLDCDHLPIFLAVPLSSAYRPNERPPSIFRKLAGMALPHTFTIIVFLQRNTRLFLFPLLLLSLPLWH